MRERERERERESSVNYWLLTVCVLFLYLEEQNPTIQHCRETCRCQYMFMYRERSGSDMAPAEKVRVLEQCTVAPPPGTVADKSLPLTFFDIPWLHFPLIHHIIFHEYPHSNPHFLHTIVPRLKRSLSLTLKHYFPFSGNLVFPSDSSKPLICYVNGDSVSLTLAESPTDFNHLTGNHLRDADEFYPLVPKLPPVTESAGTTRAPILAVQLTLFPNSGICVGFTFRRVVADGNACTSFIRSFASITKLGGDEAVLSGGLVPFFERSVVEEKDPNGLDHLFWTQVGKKKFEGSQPQYVPTNKVRATFVLGQDHVMGLKKWVTAQRPTMSHVSTFTVTCAYVWACLVKARGASVDEDEVEHFVFGADCRSLLDPPVPATYFGNCLVNCLATVKTAQLVQQEGLLAAAEAIGGAIFGKLRSGVGVLKGAEKWVSELRALKQDRIVGVAGSPRFAVYDMDFGWGKPKKSEVVSIDINGSVSLNECRDSKGDMEVGVSLPKVKMDAFAAIFADGLKIHTT